MDDAIRPAEPVLAIDIGGTKTVAALVRGATASDPVTIPTDRSGGPDAWLAAIARQFAPQGGYARVAAAVSGLVQSGHWSALNPATLALPPDYPLTATLERLFSASAYAANDAQAAAWGEYRYGAGEGEDLVFLTISTGVGGGIVVNGRPLLGLAGHFGLLHAAAGGPLEDTISGHWIAATARSHGHDVSAVGVFAAASVGDGWATAIVDLSAQRVASLCADIQLTLDPRRIVIGGGIGLAPGFLSRIESQLAGIAPRLRPRLAAAKLGANAGMIGVADLSRQSWTS